MAGTKLADIYFLQLYLAILWNDYVVLNETLRGSGFVVLEGDVVVHSSSFENICGSTLNKKKNFFFPNSSFALPSEKEYLSSYYDPCCCVGWLVAASPQAFRLYIPLDEEVASVDKDIAVSDNNSSTIIVAVVAPRIERPEGWSMPAASEAIPIRVPIGAQRSEDGFVPCGVIDSDNFPLESVEDPPYFLDMSHCSQSVEDDGPSDATIFAQHFLRASTIALFECCNEMLAEMFLSAIIKVLGKEQLMPVSAAKISEALPVGALPGEALESTMDTGSGTVYITNYRIVILDRVKNALAIVPLLSVDAVEFWSGDPYGIQISCKFGRICRLRCASEVQVELHKRLQKATYSIATNDVFAWQFARAAKAELPGWLRFHSETGDCECSAQKEFVRLNYNPRSWRVSEANADYSLCATYPKSVIVPKDITDDELRRACAARNNARFPAAVWCCDKNESVLLRSSQPCCGIFNYRFPLDEKLLECARKAVNGGPSSRKLLIVDCRSYTAALANRVVKEYYQQTEVIFCGLANIHEIRSSFHKLRTVLAGPQDHNTILQSIQSTFWLQYLTSLIDTAQKCVKALVDDGRSVLVHCTDGWDRTTQIVTLTKIIADPYYRTFEGFKLLIRRDWIGFGHKFADRTGTRSSVSGESSPVFLQWLDCVHQLHHLFPDAFQFTLSYLTKLAVHCYSGLFGTFLWNSQSERENWDKDADDAETLSLWTFLDESKPEYGNVIYNPGKSNERLHTSLHVEDLHIWKQLYIGPAIERLINEQTLPNSGMGASQHSEVDRISLNRAHSAESLSNTDIGTCQGSSNTSFTGNTHAQFHNSNTRTSISSETDYARPDENDLSFAVYRERDRNAIAREVDCDGLTKVLEIREERTREKVERLQERINVLQERLGQMRMEEMRKVSCGVSGESPRTELQIFGDCGSASCSVESVLSNMSVVEKDDVADISYGSKGWLMDDASQKCMSCQGTFYYLSNRRHHCRNCGGIFCSSCSKRTFFRVYENKGGNVRVCNKCYEFMTKARPHQLYVVSSEPSTAALDSKNGGSITIKPSKAAVNGASVSSKIYG
uniref:phosphatidylinositol-3,5-bisphosphate 3-phosphatase n=1 Tax=Setaria digitata TaxID=48799 RepID=A0A915Q084_9BILA